MHTIHAPFGVAIAWCETPLERRQASRRMLRDLLAPQLGDDFDLVQQCPVCGSDAHGPVRVQPRASHSTQGPRQAPLVSVSYAGSLTVVGLAPPGTSAFGIDVEFDSLATQQAVAEALGESADAPTVRDWTRLEAAAKADSRGLRGDWAQRSTTAGADGLVCFDLTIPGTPAAAILSVALGRTDRIATSGLPPAR